MSESAVHLFGIRHHGPGSARSLLAALEQLEPDCVLIEGPEEGEELLALAASEAMQPPVALLVYVPDQPQLASFFPMAVFSPEWQAIRYGLARGLPIRLMDLSQTHQLALEAERRKKCFEGVDEANGEGEGVGVGVGVGEEEEEGVGVGVGVGVGEEEGEGTEAGGRGEAEQELHLDPLNYIGRAAGYSDGERWWEHLVEERRDAAGVFAAIRELMTALRSDVPLQLPEESAREEDRARQVRGRQDRARQGRGREEALREAAMRQRIRQAQREGFKRIAVVCGAWHVPALAAMPPAKDDAALLKGLPKIKTQATWAPWSYGRLARASGYGAGIESPGWYDHLWTCVPPQRNGSSPHARERVEAISIRWLTRVAQLFREEDLAISSAHVIEAVRLTEALAALRGRPLPGLPELNDAVQTIFCFGDALPMRLVETRLLVGDRLGTVPPETPAVPLQRDLESEQKRLRMKVAADSATLKLDLRKPNDLERSHLLHRLGMLSIPWGELQAAGGSRGYQKGTFHEIWTIQWKPEFAIRLIEASVWGVTVRGAAAAFACDAAAKARRLAELTAIINDVMHAELSEAVGFVMSRIQAEAAVASDVPQIMDALPPLANIMRYGSVRKMDAALIEPVLDGLFTRVVVGLIAACQSLDDDAAKAMLQRIQSVDGVVAILQVDAHTAEWQKLLTKLVDIDGLHGLISGRCLRLLLERECMTPDDAAPRMSRALSRGNDPAQAAAWIEGFLSGGAHFLLHDDRLWNILDAWICGLGGETFLALLPLIRRTFATFSWPERRSIGERVKQGPSQIVNAAAPARSSDSSTPAQARGDFDEETATLAVETAARLLGIDLGGGS